MDNKLSELSKPAAWVLHARGGDVPTLDECYVANAEGMEIFGHPPSTRKSTYPPCWQSWKRRIRRWNLNGRSHGGL